MIGDFKFYEVGGKIRDELLGLTNKDVDYVAVPTEAVYSKIHPCEAQLSPAQLMFKALKSYLEEQKFEIFLVTPECILYVLNSQKDISIKVWQTL